MEKLTLSKDYFNLKNGLVSFDIDLILNPMVIFSSYCFYWLTFEADINN